MKTRWIFAITVGALCLLWLVLNRPHTEDAETPEIPYTTRHAGWPDHFARWSFEKESRQTFFSSFSTGVFLFDLAPLVALIAIAWFITRHFRPPVEKPKPEVKGLRGAPPRHGTPGHTRRPSGRG